MTQTPTLNDPYMDPDNQKPAGQARSIPRRPLTEHVPIRFDPEMIRWVREIAARDGLTVSSWIRRQVEKAVERRRPLTLTAASAVPNERSTWPPAEAPSTGHSEAIADEGRNRQELASVT